MSNIFDELLQGLFSQKAAGKKTVADMRGAAPKSKPIDELIAESPLNQRAPDSAYQQVKKGIEEWATANPDGWAGGAAPYTDAEIAAKDADAARMKGYASGALPYSDAEIAYNAQQDRGLPFVAQQAAAGMPLFGQVMAPPKPSVDSAPEPKSGLKPAEPFDLPVGGDAVAEGVPEKLARLDSPIDPSTLGQRVNTSLTSKPSSRARTEATGGANRQSTSEPDQITKMLLGQTTEATNERDAAKAKAEATKNMSNEEKIAMALIGALPGLIGTIAGGAIGGGWGAAAGAAGGLQGSAQGIGMMNQAKQDQRKEALAEAEKAQGRIDQLGNQKLVHAEHMGDQKFHRALQEDAQRHATKLALLNNQGDIIRAQIAAAAHAAGAGGGQATDGERNSARYATRMLHSRAEIDRLIGTGYRPSSMGNALEPVTPNFMVPKDLQQWTAAKRNWIAGNLRKDSGAAISDKEYMIDDKKYFPQPGDDPATVQEKARLRLAEEQSMIKSAGRATQSIVLPSDITEQADGSLKVSNKDYFGF